MKPIEEYYSKVFEQIHYKGCTGCYTRHYHKALESGLVGSFEKIIELGGGTGEHIEFIKHPFSLYVSVDIELPKRKTFNHYNENTSSIFFNVANVQNLSFNSSTFDRAIVTCLLHHVENPIKSLTEIRRVTKNDGKVSIYLPSDPGLIYRVAQFVTTGIKLNRALKKADIKLTSSQLNAIEHRNHVRSLNKLIGMVFKNDSITKKRFPIKFLSWNFSLYTIYNIKIDKQYGNTDE